MAEAAALAAPLPRAADAAVESPARRALRRLIRRRGAVVALAVIAALVLLAVAAPWVTPYDPVAQSWMTVRKAPSALHWFGTDEVGRDVLTRVVFGARASLMAGVISIAIALTIGVPLGLIAGYLGGFVDALIGRLTDAMLACPFLILAIALAAFLGPSLGNPVFALGHIVPNILPALLVQATLSIAAAIIAEAALSFLGLGQQPPAPSWGSMLNSAQRFLVNAPWMAVWPGLAIFATVLSFNLLGDGLRDALDPRER